MLRPDPRHVALGIDDYRWPAVRAVASGGDRILILLGDSGDFWCDLYQSRRLLEASDLGVFGIGFVAAFLSGFVCVRWLLRFVATHDFRGFAWYRIAFGALILVTATTGWIRWS